MNCNYDELLNKIAPKKLDKKVEVTVEVLSDLPFCRAINTRKYIDVKPTSAGVTPAPQYNRYAIPDNVFECMPVGCKNTGTLVAGVEGDVVFRLPYDATEFGSGVVTFYVKDATENTVTVKIGNASDFADADVYTVDISNLKANSDGYKAVIVDLSKAPASVVGNGWTPSANGAYLSISTDATMGLSTVAVFDSLADFNTSSVVKIACLTELGGDYEIEAAEATCVSGGYDTSTEPELERTVTGTMMTPNYWVLNPLAKKGNATFTSIQRTGKFAVEAQGDYGVVTIPDISPEECGFVSAQIDDACNVSDSELERLIIPSQADVDERQYFVIKNNDGTATVYFNKALVGMTVLVDYPKQVEAKEIVGNPDFLGEKRVRIKELVTYVTGDGRVDSQHMNVFENILITGFTDTLSEDETEFTLTYRLQRGRDGHIFKRYEILE